MNKFKKSIPQTGYFWGSLKFELWSLKGRKRVVLYPKWGRKIVQSSKFGVQSCSRFQDAGFWLQVT